VYEVPSLTWLCMPANGEGSFGAFELLAKIRQYLQ
jgi:hypothetical protein